MNVAYYLSESGVNFYRTATLKNGRNKVGLVYFLCNPLSDENIKKISLELGQRVIFNLSSKCQYAPEIKTKLLLILSKAEAKRRGIKLTKNKEQ